MKKLFHNEFKQNGETIIISTVETGLNTFESMALYEDGTEIDSFISHSEEEAAKAHKTLKDKYRPLPAKYAKLRDDIKEALAVGQEAERINPRDRGACNFDSPCIYLHRWNRNYTERAVEEAGSHGFYSNLHGFVFSPLTTAQAEARTTNAKAVSAFLKQKGYTVSVYYRLD
jgi:hypothetical protein